MTFSRALSLPLLLAGSLAAAQVAFAQANPLDVVGAQRDRTVDCLMTGKAPTDAEAFAFLARNCGDGPGMPVDAFVEANKALTALDYDAPLAVHAEHFRGQYSAAEFAYFGRIDAVFASAKDEMHAAELLTALEAEAVATLDARSASGRSVLGMLSTARHSLAYWSRYEGSGNEVGAAWWLPWRTQLYGTVRAEVVAYLYTGSEGVAGTVSYWYWWWLWRWG